MMKRFLSITVICLSTVAAYNLPTESTSPQRTTAMFNRRSWFASLATAAAAAAAVTTITSLLTATSSPALAAEAEEDVYFGVGCFWHIQHEFVMAERELLGRNDHELTSAAGYAGGKSADEEGRVCYHNLRSVADYGKLGHGEVVGMKLPSSSIADFAQVYFSLFNPVTKDRVDPMDRGSEYRSLIGLPGGMAHPSYPKIDALALQAGLKLRKGRGHDNDTLGRQIVYVYDTSKFPFYQAEVYHQYHDDFQSRFYGKAYNDLAQLALREGRIHKTGCPDRV